MNPDVIRFVQDHATDGVRVDRVPDQFETIDEVRLNRVVRAGNGQIRNANVRAVYDDQLPERGPVHGQAIAVFVVSEGEPVHQVVGRNRVRVKVDDRLVGVADQIDAASGETVGRDRNRLVKVHG